MTTPIETVRVTETYRDTGKRLSWGKVTFTPVAERLTVAEQAILLPLAVEAKVLNGSLTADLVPNDAIGLLPAGWAYLVQEEFGGKKMDPYTIVVTSSMAPTVRLSALAPLGSSSGPAPFSYVRSVNGETGAVTVDKTSLGLSNVDNTSDATKPVSTAQATAIAAVQAASIPKATGKNLFDPATATVGKFWNGSPTAIDLAGYAATQKYQLTDGVTYSINNARNVQIWNAAGTASVNYINNTTEAPVTFTGSPTQGWVSWNVSTAKLNTSQFEVNPPVNLFDPATATAGQFWNGSTTTIPLAGWNASIKYPMTNGVSYTITNARNVQVWNAAGTASVNYINNVTEAPVTVVGSSTQGYVSWNVSDAKLYTSRLDAPTSTDFEPYGIVISNQLVGGKLLSESVANIDALAKLPAISVFRSGQKMLVRARFDSTRDIVIPLHTANGAASMFQLANSSLSSVSLVTSTALDSAVWPTVASGLAIHGTGDDNCPINVGWSYVGGNHGYSVGSLVTLNAHGKTTADLGSQWSDGTRTYTLLQIPSANTLLFGGQYTVASGIVTGNGTAPAATLTHVSGATNTSSVSIAGGVLAAQQIYPSSFDQTVTVELDGKPVPDGKTSGQVLLVTETYSVASYKGLIDTAQANVGTPVSTIMSSVPALCRVSNTYRFMPGGLLVVAQRVTAIEKFNLSMGVTQAYGLITSPGGTLKQFMAGVGTVNGLNFNTLADLSGMTNTIISAAAGVNPNYPAATAQQWAYDSSGNPQYGIALGILPIGDGLPAMRAKNAPAEAWFISASTKKNYPQLVFGKTLNIADSVSGTAFRKYLAPPDTAVEFTVNDGTNDWVIVERTNVNNDGRFAAPTLLGRRLSLALPGNIVAADRVTGEGIAYVAPAAAGYGIWRAVVEPVRVETIPGATSTPGNWFMVIQSPATTLTLTGSFQILYLFPQYIPESVPVDDVAIEVVTVGTGVLRHGVYANDPATGQPILGVAPIIDYGAVDVTTTGVKETVLASRVFLPAGWHWYAVCWQGTNTTAPGIRANTTGAGMSGPFNIGTSSALMNAGRFGFSNTGVAGAFGALATMGQHQLQIPRVAYRRA